MTVTSPRRGRWMATAACRGMDPELFFDSDRAPDARRVCSPCRVRCDCLAYAVAAGETDGIWGGLTPPERGSPSWGLSEPRRRGPAPWLDDGELVTFLADADPDSPAAPQLRAHLALSPAAVYKYLNRARQLGVVERRHGVLYPVDPKPAACGADRRANG